MLKDLSDKCKSGKCKHKKCVCGHCSWYHLDRGYVCCKINQDLSTCKCKIFDKLK